MYPCRFTATPAVPLRALPSAYAVGMQVSPRVVEVPVVVGLRKLLRVHRHGHLEHVVDLLFSFTPVTFPLLYHVAHGYFQLTKGLQWVKGAALGSKRIGARGKGW